LSQWMSVPLSADIPASSELPELEVQPAMQKRRNGAKVFTWTSEKKPFEVKGTRDRMRRFRSPKHTAVSSVLRRAAHQPGEQFLTLVRAGSRRVRRGHEAAVNLVQNRAALRVDGVVLRKVVLRRLDAAGVVAGIAAALDERRDVGLVTRRRSGAAL